ncbi:hypothetical protein ACFVGY_34955 [Streptomyces sp. NPDC127106]|uniref:hypothetical protein n=1 Tax=Streptomyces sp. NPDC127106 TaxID=3345360 RepID=UPI00363B6AA4
MDRRRRGSRRCRTVPPLPAPSSPRPWTPRDPGHPAPSLPHIGDVPADPGLVLALATARPALEGSDTSVALRATGHEWEFHPSVRPALQALLSGARLILGDLAERSGLTAE